MVEISNKKTVTTYYFPKSGSEVSSKLRLYSELTHDSYEFDATDTGSSSMYYVYSISFKDVVDGEYKYTIENADGKVIEGGELRVGDIKSSIISYNYSTSYKSYDPDKKYLLKALKFTSTGAQKVQFHTYNSHAIAMNLEYSINNKDWVAWDTDTWSPEFGDGVPFYVRGYDNDRTYGYCFQFYFNDNLVSVEGDIMSLLDYRENLYKIEYDPGEYLYGCFNALFQYCSCLYDASKLVLSAEVLANDCYDDMFYNCTSLVYAPELPATELANSCYLRMFGNCTSLVDAPALPATELRQACYSNMFNGCTSLVTAPKLPATDLATNCYKYMFAGCNSLVNAPELPATTLANWCYSNMFKYCTSLEKAPELPALVLGTNGQYENMFYNCSSLNYIKILAIETNPNLYATKNWVYGVGNTGTFICKTVLKDALTIGNNGIPNGWTVQTIN